MLLAVGAAASGACGLSATATGDGVAEGGASPLPSSSGTPGADAGVDGSQGGGCTATTCGALCTDLAGDPQNCGGCGNDCGPRRACAGGKCTALCNVDEKKCAETCVDPLTDPRNCGGCDVVCAPGSLCSVGVCRPDCGALHLCPEAGEGGPGVDAGASYCADLTSDRNNCGACGVKCAANQVCSGNACKPLCATGAAVGDTFGTPVTMTGCLGKVGYDQRASLCPAGAHVCSAVEWVARRAGKAPTYAYWTNDDLGWSGTNGSCAAERVGGYSCRLHSSDPRQPMRVCGGAIDALGNQCRYSGCGLDTASPNQYFGGCQGNPTASTLCCE
ncbi:MAG: Tryptophan synthase alpha chain [Labilithrix sp.]|nr:Tryptophan synthase alpha chain [Labilithrix sp.]